MSITPNTSSLHPDHSLHYLGHYVRDIPVSLNRMMENAYDWEHLPFVHPSSFASITLIEEGEWGWRCNTTLPPAAGGGVQEVQLLVDKSSHYWATTVLSGTGEGVQIHTQAVQTDIAQARGIKVDVRFYLPQAPETEAQAAMILGYLQTQYQTLYDEDAALMGARQDALDAKKSDRRAAPSRIDLGPAAQLDPASLYPVTMVQGRFIVRHHAGEWIAHSAVCPHMLGPLADAEIEVDGTVICPWHGYQFALDGGGEKQGRCGALLAPPALRLDDGHLFIGD